MFELQTLEGRRLMAFADLVSSWGVNGIGANVSVLSEQSDGRILAAETGTQNLVRLHGDGTYDATFSHDGKVPFAHTIVAARQVAGGYTVIAYYYHMRAPGQSDSVFTGDDEYINGYGVARFTARGVADTSYGSRGTNEVTFNSTTIGDIPNIGGGVIGADGSVYFGVSSSYLNILSTLKTFSSFVLKFNAAGWRDTTYGNNGIVTLPRRLTLHANGDFARIIDSLGVSDSGNLLIGGTEYDFDNGLTGNGDYVDDFTASSTFVSSFNPDGSAEARFGTGGTFEVQTAASDDFANSGHNFFEDSAKIIHQAGGHVLLVNRINGRLRVFTLTATGKSIKALNREQPDGIANETSVDHAAEMANGSLVVDSGGELIELRPTSTGYVAQAPRLPAGQNGKGVAYGQTITNTLLALHDGNVLLSYSSKSIKFSDGDGATARQDETPNGGPNSVTTPDVTNPAIPQLDMFYHDSTGGLKYRQRTTAGKWSKIQTVDASAGAGMYLSSIGTSVVYMDAGSADLKFATLTKRGTWAIQTIESAGSTGLFCSMIRTKDGSLAVAYYNRSKGDLRLARRSASGRWSIQTVDSGNAGRYAKLTLRPDGGLSIAYAINTTTGVRLAEQKAGVTKGGWSYINLFRKGADVGGLDIAYYLTNNEAESDSPSLLTTTVAIYDGVKKDLIVDYRPDSGKKFLLIREKTHGNVGLNPHVYSTDGVVSFYDRSRDRVLITSVVQTNGSYTLSTNPVPVVLSAGAYANPVISTEPTNAGPFTNGGPTDIYDWIDPATGVLKVRSPV